MRLFAEEGYEQTTIADVTAAAGVSRRTFFSYFNSKDDLLFADADEKLELLHAGFATRMPEERPIDALRRVSVETLPQATDELMGRGRDARLQVLLARPDLQASCMRRVLAGEREMAAALHAAFPDELSEFQAIAVTGALVAVAIRSMQGGEPQQQMRTNLLWTLDLLEAVLDTFSEPPGLRV